MSRLRRHAALAWLATVLACLLLVVAVRVWSGWANRPVASMGADTRGVATADAAGLDATSRRVRELHDQTGDLRRRLAAIQTEASAARDRIATLDAMLATDRLTQCPTFLRDQTTVRALQKLIQEASASTGEAPHQDRLNTAATVARERLRAKLGLLRAQSIERLGGLETDATSLRQELRLRQRELDRLAQQRRQHPPPGRR